MTIRYTIVGKLPLFQPISMVRTEGDKQHVELRKEILRALPISHKLCFKRLARASCELCGIFPVAPFSILHLEETIGVNRCCDCFGKIGDQSVANAYGVVKRAMRVDANLAWR